MTSAESQAHTRVTIGSNRSFGLVFALVFALVGLYPLLGEESPRPWALGLSVAFLVLALMFPLGLQPLNRAWFAIGLMLGHIVNPLVMFLIYIVAIVPTGLVLRLLGKDPLRLAIDRQSRSYWIERQPPGPPPESMDNQF